jgi:hypothetical protein
MSRDIRHVSAIQQRNIDRQISKSCSVPSRGFNGRVRQLLQASEAAKPAQWPKPTLVTEPHPHFWYWLHL